MSSALPAHLRNKESASRWEDLEALQAEYRNFEPFLIDCMEDLLGFKCTDIQIDIGNYLQFGPQYLMVQAQRSQAKSTVVAIFGVWCLIHDPTYRVLILSAGAEVAQEIAFWVIQIINNWEILECMRPDRLAGDRASAKAFDIHHQLKGPEKSPSVACIGVTANMQGRRADLLIPDDIESSKNGLTEIQRQQLMHLSKDFTSICQHGRIAYMGTPQTTDSIYNALPGRGYQIRIWPGRYPNKEQLGNYKDHLAPMLLERMRKNPELMTGGGPLGDQGQPVDPIIMPEEALTKKQLDQGMAYFQLQHMLNTRLMDEDRYPLKSSDLVVMDLNEDIAPGQINWLPDPNRRVKIQGIPDGTHLYYPFTVSETVYAYENRGIYVDTAGGGSNGDETVATCTYFLHGYIFVMAQLPLPGGYSPGVFEELSEFAYKHKPNFIHVESNFGEGAFAQMWRPVLLKYYRDRGLAGSPAIEDIRESGQKELRIIDTLEPVIGRHRLIVNKNVLIQDQHSVQKYPVEKRTVYTLINQLTRLSRDRNSLLHDDRLDSLAGAVRPWVEHLAVDEEIRIQQKSTDELLEFMNSWADGPPESKMVTKVPKKAGIVPNKALSRTPSQRNKRFSKKNYQNLTLRNQRNYQNGRKPVLLSPPVNTGPFS